MQRIFEGYSTQEVADFPGVGPPSVRPWVAAFRSQGGRGTHRPPGARATPEAARTVVSDLLLSDVLTPAPWKTSTYF